MKYVYFVSFRWQGENCDGYGDMNWYSDHKISSNEDIKAIRESLCEMHSNITSVNILNFILLRRDKE